MVAETLGRFEVVKLPDDSTVYYDDAVHAYYGEVKESKSAKGGYSFVRESRLVGCSTPVKNLDSNVDPLMHWAVRLDREGIAQLATVDLDDGVKPEWLRSADTIRHMLHEHGLTWAQVRDGTAQRGTNVHELIFAALAKGERPPSLSALSDEERGYGQAAIRWWRDHSPTPLFAEAVTADLSRRVAGRFDLLCKIDGKRVLVDAKTRESGRDRTSDHAQLAGYHLCNRACGYGDADRHLVLVLKPDGTYNAVDGVGTEDDFLAALAAYRAGNDLAKRQRAGAK